MSIGPSGNTHIPYTDGSVYISGENIYFRDSTNIPKMTLTGSNGNLNVKGDIIVNYLSTPNTISYKFISDTFIVELDGEKEGEFYTNVSEGWWGSPYSTNRISCDNTFDGVDCSDPVVGGSVGDTKYDLYVNFFRKEGTKVGFLDCRTINTIYDRANYKCFNYKLYVYKYTASMNNDAVYSGSINSYTGIFNSIVIGNKGIKFNDGTIQGTVVSHGKKCLIEGQLLDCSNWNYSNIC